MLRLFLTSCVLALALATFASPAPVVEEGPSHVLLTRGIVGGFVAPHVSLRVVAVKTNAGYEVHVLEQPARNAPATFRRGTLTEAQYDELFATAKKLGIWELPREMPTGCEDIYKMDTSVNLVQGKLAWRNGGPEGCVHGESKVQATEAQRGQFRSMVEAVTEMAKKQATKPSDAEAFQTAYQLADKQTPRPKQPQ